MIQFVETVYLFDKPSWDKLQFYFTGEGILKISLICKIWLQPIQK